MSRNPGGRYARKAVEEFLDSHQIKYVTMTHSTAYTAQEIASLVHIRGDESVPPQLEMERAFNR